MNAYYNEHDKKAAAWLRELIRGGHIAAGEVDERSIVDVRASDLAGFTQCHWFGGIGGWSCALRLAGWPDARPVWTASLPCQPFSAAGQQKGGGDDRNLWPVFFRLVQECGPQRIFGEQVAKAIGFNWLDGISADLETAGYAVGSVVLGAHSVGAPHMRQRLYWLADANLPGGDRRPRGGQQSLCDANSGTYAVADSECHGRRTDEPGRSEEGRTTDGRTCGLADSSGQRVYSAERREDDGSAQRACGEEWQQRIRPDAGADCRLGNAESGGCGEQRHASLSGSGGHPERAGGAGPGWMGEPIQPRLERLAGHGADGNEPGRERATEARPTSAPSAWGDFDIIQCRDGKARRIESGTFPLASGVQGRMGLLRGYGNAIVPQVAALFIKASLESLPMTDPRGHQPNPAL